MFTITKYSESYQKKYCDLYITTWKIEPYGERFSREEIVAHLVKNRDYLYLLIEEETDLVKGFVGGRPILSECQFFINETGIDMNKAFYIDELGVDEKHKKLGWGAILTHYIISCAREDNFNQFVLRTHSSESNPAIKLYQKLGFITKLDKQGIVHGVETQQTRVDDRPDKDFRYYLYQWFGQNHAAITP
jgi:ribosomal protein S18 acetylase RimI-like enzyme